MKRTIKDFLLRLTDINRDYRIRLFYVLAMGGIAISIISFVTAMWNTAVISFVLVLISAGLIWFTAKTGKYQLAYVVTVVLVFMALFPIMFFTYGGHRSVMPSAFCYTVLLLVLSFVNAAFPSSVTGLIHFPLI